MSSENYKLLRKALMGISQGSNPFCSNNFFIILIL